MLRLSNARRRANVVLVTDPGPDPDDVKALLVAAILHKQGAITLAAVVANGGQQSNKRAKLAQRILDLLEVNNVPVGIGSQGKAYAAKPHEYALVGYESVDESRLVDGGELLADVLRRARRASLSFVLISSMRDVADLIADKPELFVAKVRHVCIQGGLEPSETAPSGYVGDSSVNNGFDPDAANAVYDFCFGRGVRMSVVSRAAVPMLPMQLAKSFALRTDCPIMHYLADAQFLGLEGLWKRLCAGELPPRCTKQWYFETFCGITAVEFSRAGYERLDANVDILRHLNGYVKPYDVVALMAALPDNIALDIFAPHAEVEVPTTEGEPVSHQLLLSPGHALDVRHVMRTLRDTYHEVVIATARALRTPRSGTGSMKATPRDTANGGEQSSSPRSTAMTEAAMGAHMAFAQLGSPARTLDSPLPFASKASFKSKGRLRSDGSFAIERMADGVPSRAADGVLSEDDIVAQLELAIDDARLGMQRLTRYSAGLGYSLFFGGVVFAALGAFLAFPLDEPTNLAIMFISCIAWVSGLPLLLLALFPTRSHRWLMHLWSALLGLLCAGGGAIYTAWTLSALCQPTFSEARHSCHHHVNVAVGGALVSAVLYALALLQLRAVTRPSAGAHLRLLWRSVALLALAFALNEIHLMVYDELYTPDRVVTPAHALFVAMVSVVAIVMLAPGSRPAGHGIVSRIIGSNGQRAGLAPLIGGLDRPIDAASLAAEGIRCFRPVPLGEEVFALLRAHRSTSLSSNASSMQTSPYDPTLGTGLVGATPLRRHEPNPVVAAAARLVRLGSAEGPYHVGSAHGEKLYRPPTFVATAFARRTMLGPAAASSASLRVLPTDSAGANRARGELDGGTATIYVDGEPADAYIVHSTFDSAEHKSTALREWARHFVAQHGRQAIVWYDGACVDPSLTSAARLAHMPVYLARSRRLLVLAGPTLVTRLWPVLELYAWLAMGGSLDDVDIIPIVPGDDDTEALLASFDAFHVAYARAAGSAERRLFLQAIDFASVGTINEAVRSYLSIIRQKLAAEDDAVEAI